MTNAEEIRSMTDEELAELLDRQDYSEFINEVEVIGNIFDNPELLEVKNG